MRIGAIEAGGTKFICAIAETKIQDDGWSKPVIKESISIPTAKPEVTLQACLDFFRSAEPIERLGIASFGPVELDPLSTQYGFITTTPKPGWKQTDIVGFFKNALQIPVFFDTDVNGAVLSEHRWGNGKGLSDFVYITIGTGIGGGIMANGRLIHGAMHPELGHFLPQKHQQDDFAGICPFHGACLEGLASGPAIAARWKTPGEKLPDDHAAWEIEAYYLAQVSAMLAMTLATRRILLGGSVGMRSGIVEKTRKIVPTVLGSYLSWLNTPQAINSFLMNPLLGNQAGILGAAALTLE